MKSFNDFCKWELASRDTIEVKRIYVDMAGDLVSGILLSQIIYWFLPDKNGKSKLRVEHDGQYWLAKKREDWWDECRISLKQFDRAITDLCDAGIIIKKVFKFANSPTVHIRVNFDIFSKLLEKELNNDQEGGKLILPKGEDQSLPMVEIEVDETVKSIITETTTETTSKTILQKKESDFSLENRKSFPINTPATDILQRLAKAENNLSKDLESPIKPQYIYDLYNAIKHTCGSIGVDRILKAHANLIKSEWHKNNGYANAAFLFDVANSGRQASVRIMQMADNTGNNFGPHGNVAVPKFKKLIPMKVKYQDEITA